MEKTTGVSTLTVIITVSAAVALSCIVTFVVTYTALRPQCAVNVADTLPVGGRDYVERMHANGVTAMRAWGVNKCFILTGEASGPLAGQVLSVLGTAMDEAHIAAVYGSEIADFCDGRPGYAVALTNNVEAHRRKRQTQPIPGPERENGGVGRPVNECQNQQLVFCTDNQAEYQCNTGVGEVFAANIKCNSENEFTFSLTRRCDQFAGTKGDRFIKCLAKFAAGPARRGKPLS